ncbi:MAG: hypothetical protein ACOX5Q_06965 [Bacillota bacterium]
MKYVLRTVVTCLLSVAVLVCALPATVLAADNEPVLTSIRHSSAVAAVGVAGVTTATLTVPYSHGNQVNLSQGLDVSFNTSIYAVAIPTFPNGATATVGGEAVDMVVTYQRKNSSALYTTTYKIKVVRAEFAAPSFSGSIAKSTNLSQSITFALSDFSDKYVKNDGGDLASIVISGSNPSFGTLKLANGIYTPGTPVSVMRRMSLLKQYLITTILGHSKKNVDIFGLYLLKTLHQKKYCFHTNTGALLKNNSSLLKVVQT